MTSWRMDCLVKKRSWRKVRKPEKVKTRALPKGPFRRAKCEYTGLRTTLSGVGVLSAWLEEQRVGPHFRQEVDEAGEVPTICFDYCFLRDHPGGGECACDGGTGKEIEDACPCGAVQGWWCWTGWSDNYFVDLRKMGVPWKM